MQQIAAVGHIHFDQVPAKWQRVFVTAHDVTPEWHIQMQAAFQECTDSAISKTCNFANDATEEYVEKIYRYAYKLGCKGVTVYRDGAREMQVLSTGSTAQKVQAQAATTGSATVAGAPTGADALAEALGRLAELEAELGRTRAQLHDAEAENLQRRAKRSRPDLLKGATRRIETPLGTMYVNITEDDKGQPFEVFISLGKAGGALMADVEAIGRLISLALRSGIPMREVYRQLRGISSDRVVGLGPNKVLSVPDAIGIAIEKWMQEKQGIQQDLLGGVAAAGALALVREAVAGPEGVAGLRSGGAEQDFIGACPDCGSQLAFIEGCAKCHVCGFSECG
jgi:ribonucleoside-diphosphate reductase alpha chain